MQMAIASPTPLVGQEGGTMLPMTPAVPMSFAVHVPEPSEEGNGVPLSESSPGNCSGGHCLTLGHQEQQGLSLSSLHPEVTEGNTVWVVPQLSPSLLALQPTSVALEGGEILPQCIKTVVLRV